MKCNFGQIGFSLVAALLLLAANPLYAQDVGYLQCAIGGEVHPVRDPFGNCILSPGGDPLPECLPAVAAPEPTPAPIMRSLGADANFDFDKSELRPEGRSALEQLYADMQQVDVEAIDIVGHTDSIGTVEYNQGLSERRAQSAADYLVALGTDPGLISTRGMSELQPIAPNTNPDGSDNPEGRAKNRRVDITVNAKTMAQ